MAEKTLERMGRHIEHIMETEEIVQTPTEPNERVTPPIVHIDFTPGFPDEPNRNQEFFWLGRETFKAPHFDDDTVKKRIIDAVEGRDHLTGKERVQTEYDVVVDESQRGPKTIVTETTWAFQEIYECSLSDIDHIEWDDLATSERLSKSEYLEKYGDKF